MNLSRTNRAHSSRLMMILTALLAGGAAFDSSARAQVFANDNADTAPYADGTYIGDNGGTGYGAWQEIDNLGGGNFVTTNEQRGSTPDSFGGFHLLAAILLKLPARVVRVHWLPSFPRTGFLEIVRPQTRCHRNGRHGPRAVYF